jgi:hypothetical protein
MARFNTARGRLNRPCESVRLAPIDTKAETRPARDPGPNAGRDSTPPQCRDATLVRTITLRALDP